MLPPQIQDDLDNLLHPPPSNSIIPDICKAQAIIYNSCSEEWINYYREGMFIDIKIGKWGVGKILCLTQNTIIIQPLGRKEHINQKVYLKYLAIYTRYIVLNYY